MQRLNEILPTLDLAGTLAFAALSESQGEPLIRGGASCSRIRIQPFGAGGNIRFQAELQCGPKAYHENLEAPELEGKISAWMASFRQLDLFTERGDYRIRDRGAGMVSVVQTPPSKQRKVGAHDRAKERLVGAAQAVPYLVRLGVMDENGTVHPRMQDKFRQINRYLEFLRPAVERLPSGPLRIVDFGSGKAYLTFALHHYISELRPDGVSVVGLDVKEDVVEFCRNVARDLGCAGLRFERGDIADYRPDAAGEEPHMIVSLHACDTATDDALVRGIGWHCPVILAVPCCQHEFFKKLESSAMDAILRHGVSREKQATLVTDASRALMLEAFGYRTDLVEFIDTEHTPKNVLIRAYQRTPTETARIDPALYAEYRAFLDDWGIGRTYLEDQLALRGLLPRDAVQP